jgi:hypothetical protein
MVATLGPLGSHFAGRQRDGAVAEGLEGRGTPCSAEMTGVMGQTEGGRRSSKSDSGSRTLEADGVAWAWAWGLEELAGVRPSAPVGGRTGVLPPLWDVDRGAGVVATGFRCVGAARVLLLPPLVGVGRLGVTGSLGM